MLWPQRDIRALTIPDKEQMNMRLWLAVLPLSCLPLTAHAETMVTSHYQARAPHIAAHRTLPMGTRLTVRNPRNGRTAQVIIGDRGPFIHGRVLDISNVVAKQLGFGSSGVLSLQTSFAHKR
jgi:Lytic transglycolase